MMVSASKRRAMAALMFLLWAGTCLIAASPELHLLIHSDAKAPSHECLITQLHQHSLLSGSVGGVVPVPPASLAESQVTPAEPQFSAVFDYRLSPSRAPPTV
jgi:hypothetical protein